MGQSVSTWGQIQMSLIIRDDLEDNDEDIENGL